MHPGDSFPSVLKREDFFKPGSFPGHHITALAQYLGLPDSEKLSCAIPQPQAKSNTESSTMNDNRSVSRVLEDVGEVNNRTLEIEFKADIYEEISELCRNIGTIHAISQRESAARGNVMLVTFEDSRACSRAKLALPRVTSVSSVKEVTSDVGEHDVTGLVLAVKQVEEKDDEESIENLKSILSFFGSVSFGKVVTGPAPQTENRAIKFAVFEFYSIRDAAQAVQAIGSRPNASLSLYLLSKDGVLARSPGSSSERSSTTRVQAFSGTEESSQPSSNADFTVTTPLIPDEHVEPHANPMPLLPQDLNRVTYMASHMHQRHQQRHSSPLPAATLQLPNAPLDWSSAQHMHVLQGVGAMPPPVRRPADFLTTFDPSEAAMGGARARTTVMIRNIPCRWTAEDLLSVLSHVIEASWDLLYMPCKNAAVANAGYAFMNFVSSQDTLRLYNAMHGNQWPHTRSGKICEIRYARIQGRQLLTHLDSADPSGAAAFRGYLAYPSGGSIIIHGPNASQPPPVPILPNGVSLPMASHLGPHSDYVQFPLRNMTTPVSGIPSGLRGARGALPYMQVPTLPSEGSISPSMLKESDRMADGTAVRQFNAALNAHSNAPHSGASIQQACMSRQAGRDSLVRCDTTIFVIIDAHESFVTQWNFLQDTTSANPYQLQCMLQSLMQSIPQ